MAVTRNPTAKMSRSFLVFVAFVTLCSSASLMIPSAVTFRGRSSSTSSSVSSFISVNDHEALLETLALCTILMSFFHCIHRLHRFFIFICFVQYCCLIGRTSWRRISLFWVAFLHFHISSSHVVPLLCSGGIFYH